MSPASALLTCAHPADEIEAAVREVSALAAAAQTSTAAALLRAATTALETAGRELAHEHEAAARLELARADRLMTRALA